MAEDNDHGRGDGPLAELAVATGFLTVLPHRRPGAPTGAQADLAGAARMFPLIGAAIGLIGGIVLLLALRLGLPGFAAAILAMATTMAITGLLHEDGLADTADGLGGDTRERRLAIMRDHHIGVFGTAALVVALLLRTVLVADLAFADITAAILVLIGAEAGSRGAMVRVWHDVPPARTDGLSAGAGQPDGSTALTAAIAGAVIAFVVLIQPAGLVGALVILAGSAAAALILAEFCRNRFGGQTGDTLGATQQVTLLAFLAIAAIVV